MLLCVGPWAGRNVSDGWCRACRRPITAEKEPGRSVTVRGKVGRAKPWAPVRGRQRLRSGSKAPEARDGRMHPWLSGMAIPLILRPLSFQPGTPGTTFTLDPAVSIRSVGGSR